MDVNLQINYESTAETNLFYRLTSHAGFPLTLSAFSDTYNLAVTSTAYTLSCFINGLFATNNSISAGYFDCSSPSVSAITVTLSDASNTVTKTLSVQFVSSWLVGKSFETFPTLFFDASGNQQVNLPNSYRTTSPGTCFYGEGHTETINLSVMKGIPTENYIWYINNTTLQYSVLSLSNNYAQVSINSNSDGSLYTIPVALKTTNSIFLSTALPYYRDDITGTAIYYPNYISTMSPLDVEYRTNTPLHQSIKVVPYDLIADTLIVNIASSSIFLNSETLPQNFNATILLALAGESLDPCFGKYNTTWKWSTDCTLLSTWNARSLTAINPKKWKKENATITKTSPISRQLSSVSWELMSNYWQQPIIIDNIPTINSSSLPFTLQYSSDESIMNTVSNHTDTPITVTATAYIYSLINAITGTDWVPRYVPLTDSTTFVVTPFTKIKIYTPNKYRLIGDTITFQFINTDLFTSIIVDDGENGPISLSGNWLSTVYNYSGIKVVTVIATNSLGPKTFIFEGIVEILSEYEYSTPSVIDLRTPTTPLTLPYALPPFISPNEWVVEDTINNVLTKLNDNINYLIDRNIGINNNPEYFGWLGKISKPVTVTCLQSYAWQDFCSNQTINWNDISCLDSLSSNINGIYANCSTWADMECSRSISTQNCLGKYCINWKWGLLKQANQAITWGQTKSSISGGLIPKQWGYDGPCVINETPIVTQTCNSFGNWSVNIPNLDYHLNDINCSTSSCLYRDIVTIDNVIIAALATQILVLSSDYNATFINNSTLTTNNNLNGFTNIISIAKDSQNKIYTLDSTTGIINNILLDLTDPSIWALKSTWGGIGGSNTKFYAPNDLHVDQRDLVYVTDTGNQCCKQFTNDGVWLQTISDPQFNTTPPLSLVVDLDNNIHILTTTEIRVYDESGVYLWSYGADYVSANVPTRLRIGYSRYTVYACNSNSVSKFFMNGVFCGNTWTQTSCVTNIISMYQDEYRSAFIISDDKIVKVFDLLTSSTIPIGDLPYGYWSLNDLLIHREEYIQNWVYNRAFQRAFDNIELFRSILPYDQTICKGFTSPPHAKDKMIIGQNEILTSTVLNRVIGYLWDNFNTLIPYFDPGCINI